MLQDAMYWLHGCCMGFVLGESRGRKPCVFPCKVAPAGDERYLVCAAGAGWVRPRLGVVRTVMAASFLHIAVTWCFGIFACKTHCNGCMDAAWASFWEKAGAGNLVFFRVKWLRPAMKGTSWCFATQCPQIAL